VAWSGRCRQGAQAGEDFGEQVMSREEVENKILNK